MAYRHPLAYLVGLEGLALLRGFAGEHDRRFAEDRLAEVRRLLDDERLTGHPGVDVDPGATAPVYERWAATYDDPGNGLLALDEPLVDEVLATVPAGDAVDVACGTGRLAARLAARGHRVVGVDSSEAMLRVARRRLPGASLLVGEMRALPLRDATVDVVTNGLALTHEPALGPVLAELARVLRPGGVAIVSDVHPELVALGSVPHSDGPDGRAQLAAAHRHRVGDYVRAALAAGFVVDRLEELPPSAPATRYPLLEPVHEVGSWQDWPWSLLGWDPEATAATWDQPSVLVLVLRRV